MYNMNSIGEREEKKKKSPDLETNNSFNFFDVEDTSIKMYVVHHSNYTAEFCNFD